MRKTALIVISIITLLLATTCSYEPVRRIRDPYFQNIIVIGIDGGGALFDNGDAVNDDFKDFFSVDGNIFYNYKCETPSISAQNWGAYLHGVTPDKLEVNNLKIASVRFTDTFHPSVFQVIHDAAPDFTLASICHWTPINYGLIETSAGVYKDNDIRFRFETYSDQEVRDHVVEYVEANMPTLLFVHLDDVDETGHSKGYGSPEHLEAIRMNQGLILEMFAGYDPDTTLFLVVTDHGGTPDGEHGGDTEPEMRITLAIRGKGLDLSAFDGFDYHPRDLAPIILTALGIEVPSCMDGHCPTGLFKNI